MEQDTNLDLMKRACDLSNNALYLMDETVNQIDKLQHLKSYKIGLLFAGL